jgi:hypothetical protein
MRYVIRNCDEDFHRNELVDTRSGDVIAVDYGEPEDNSFNRDWHWVPDLLNHLSAEIDSLNESLHRFQHGQEIESDYICGYGNELLRVLEKQVTPQHVLDAREQLWTACEAFLDEHDVSHPETVYQCDRVAEHALELVETVGEIVGWCKDVADVVDECLCGQLKSKYRQINR